MRSSSPTPVAIPCYLYAVTSQLFPGKTQCEDFCDLQVKVSDYRQGGQGERSYMQIHLQFRSLL